MGTKGSKVQILLINRNYMTDKFVFGIIAGIIATNIVWITVVVLALLEL